ncbi:MAG: COX15/CtaA family protein [Rhodospirillales bacterium]|nr:COX15/CtaA family protein [Rhodospirillales bacterium]
MDNGDARLMARARVLAGWLFAICAMIYVMVLIGGLTRLTYSGLSMVEWKPLTGWLPPLSPEAWEAAFSKYRDFPEYRELNMGMSLDEFKFIYLMEYSHRLWGRLIGVAFLVPFVVFFIKGWIDARLLPKLLAMFVLGGLQGVLGWYMVQSGLVDEPDVSPYRLTAHLGFAIVVYAYIFWVALDLWGRPEESRGEPAPGGLRRLGLALPILVFVTILSGGFMAGINAGFAYNTFPTMDGEWIPEGLFGAVPVYLSFFEDVTTVQFNHRMLAYAVVIIAVVLWFYARGVRLSGRARTAINCVPVFALLQAVLGISTILLIVPTALAATHQAGAVALLTVTIWAAHALRDE